MKAQGHFSPKAAAAHTGSLAKVYNTAVEPSLSLRWDRVSFCILGPSHYIHYKLYIRTRQNSTVFSGYEIWCIISIFNRHVRWPKRKIKFKITSVCNVVLASIAIAIRVLPTLFPPNNMSYCTIIFFVNCLISQIFPSTLLFGKAYAKMNLKSIA